MSKKESKIKRLEQLVEHAELLMSRYSVDEYRDMVSAIIVRAKKTLVE